MKKRGSVLTASREGAGPHFIWISSGVNVFPTFSTASRIGPRRGPFAGTVTSIHKLFLPGLRREGSMACFGQEK